MPHDFEQLLKDVFGESLAKLTQFQKEQADRLMGKLQEIAREAVKDELVRLHSEIGELQSRLTRLEQERAEAAADSVETSF
ncbi:MAG TPA: hypothetical protein VNA04_02850 [Thermoanaerobaculia bacterium]|nr:hypothetical protein [Thermoanaerobaculia bacterium]